MCVRNPTFLFFVVFSVSFSASIRMNGFNKRPRTPLRLMQTGLTSL